MTTEVSFTEDVANKILKDLQSWWEIPSLAQYISLFREPFNLPEIEIEELENGFVDDTCKGPNTWLQNLVIAFLRSIMPRSVTRENWETQLRKLIKRNWPKDEQNPFEEDRSFHELTVRSKVVIVYSLCLYRLDRNDIGEVMKSMDAEALRVQKLGVDDSGNTYWYFYGTRLYKEEGTKKKKWTEEWKQQKDTSFKKKRGRGRPRKQPLPMSDGESDGFDDSDYQKNDGFMNVNEKSRWSVVCDTIEEWVNFAEKFKDSKSKEETSLFKIIQENFLPTLNKIYEEKEKKFQQKFRELMPAREKIVTRRETRKLRGEDVDYSPVNDYSSDERYYPIKDRAQRLEERNKRASGAEEVVILPRKRRRNGESGNERNSSIDRKSVGKADEIQSQMEKLMTSVKLHKDAWPFLFPVDEEDAPGYSEIIREPIDLSLIENRLYNGDYETVGELDADFSKMVSNCELYNGEFHAFSKMAQMLRITFRKGVANILDSMELSENTTADSMELSENTTADSDGSNDSQYHSNSNSVSPPLELPVLSVPVHKKSKEKTKKRKRSSEAIDLLAEAQDLAVQDSFVNRTSPPKKKSPVPQQPEAAPHVPLTNMPYSPVSTSHSNISKPGLKSSFIPSNNFAQECRKERPITVPSKPQQNVKRKPTEIVTTTSLNVASSTNTNNVPHNNGCQTLSPKTVPVVFSYNNTPPSTQQNDLQFKGNPNVVTTTQSMPNSLPVVQQVLIPSGQQIQVQSNGQFMFASPQNAGRLLNKDQNIQFLNTRQVNQGFGKVMPQFITSAPVLQVSKDMMPNLQFQTVSQNGNQAFTQVTQSPQYINVPTYLLTNQNATAESLQQSGINLQPYQLPQRQLHIANQGNL